MAYNLHMINLEYKVAKVSFFTQLSKNVGPILWCPRTFIMYFCGSLSVCALRQPCFLFALLHDFHFRDKEKDVVLVTSQSSV